VALRIRGTRLNGRLCDSGPALAIASASCAQGLYCYLDICACDGGGCTVWYPGSKDTVFDLSLAGTILSGNVVLSDFEGMHLTRVP
jgi:hypothetical protein